MNKISGSYLLDHIGIAVNSLEIAVKKYLDLMGAQIVHRETLHDQRLSIVFLSLGNHYIELIEPLDESSVISRFLNKRGEGLHHVAYITKDIYSEFDNIKGKNLRVLSKEPYKGAWGKLVFFVHPKDTGGVLIEFCQKTVDYYSEEQ